MINFTENNDYVKQLVETVTGHSVLRLEPIMYTTYNNTSANTTHDEVDFRSENVVFFGHICYTYYYQNSASNSRDLFIQNSEDLNTSTPISFPFDFYEGYEYKNIMFDYIYSTNTGAGSGIDVSQFKLVGYKCYLDV